MSESGLTGHCGCGHIDFTRGKLEAHIPVKFRLMPPIDRLAIFKNSDTEKSWDFHHFPSLSWEGTRRSLLTELAREGVPGEGP